MNNFTWIAIFLDGSKIEQFNPDGTENKFQLIKDRFNELSYFNLTDRNGHFFSVDTINGLIGYNYLILPYVEIREKKNSVRLVFFRRHKVEISEKGQELSHNIEYHLGFQYNDEKNNNHKIILQIDEEGNWILGS